MLGFLGAIGIKHFSQELFDDVSQNPLQYSASLFTGMATYFNLSSPAAGIITAEVIKSIFSIFNALIIFIIIFVAKKTIEPFWDQRLKKIIYKWFNLNP